MDNMQKHNNYKPSLCHSPEPAPTQPGQCGAMYDHLDITALPIDFLRIKRSFNHCINIVACRPIAKEWLCKQRLLLGNRFQTFANEQQQRNGVFRAIRAEML
jgi:hypothetical protein